MLKRLTQIAFGVACLVGYLGLYLVVFAFFITLATI